jgi:hypothetical protein
MSLVTSLKNLTLSPLSRCVLVMQEISRRALARDAAAIADMAGRAAAQARRTIDLDAQQAAGITPEVAELAHMVDHGVNAIHGYCNAQISVYRGEQRAAAAERVKHSLLPGSAHDISALPHAAQPAEVDALLRRAKAPALAAEMSLLVEMPVLLARLRVLNQKYDAALLRIASSGPTSRAGTADSAGSAGSADTAGTTGSAGSAVRAERERCQELLAETVALIQEHCAQPERRADRDYLLEPILRHDLATNDEHDRSIESAA